MNPLVLSRALDQSRAVMRCRGFTLVELLVVLVVLAVLASVAFPLAETTARRQKEQALREALREIRGALDEHKRLYDEGRLVRALGASGYPKTLDDLVRGLDNPALPDEGKIYLLRRIPSDPFAPNGQRGAEGWGLRSYASPPEDPRPGEDVFDVYSLSTQTGLNGVPYRNW